MSEDRTLLETLKRLGTALVVDGKELCHSAMDCSQVIDRQAHSAP
jgi:hypothetical protein